MKIKIISLTILSLILFGSKAGAEKIIPFQGELDFSTQTFTMDVDLGERSIVKLDIHKSSDQLWQMLLNLDHIQTPYFEITSELKGSVEEFPNEASDSKFLKGYLRSQYTLVDMQPIMELTGRFTVKDGRVQISSVAMGPLMFNGSVNLQKPYNVNLICSILSMRMEDFLKFWSPNKKYETDGLVSGEIKVSGHPDQLVLRGKLESFNGFINKLKYDSLYLNAEGTYPRLEITNSVLTKSEGLSFTLDGMIDLKDRVNFKKQIKALAIAPLVSDSSAQREWTIKRSTDGESTTEFKYLLRKDDKEASGVLGIEKSMEF